MFIEPFLWYIISLFVIYFVHLLRYLFHGHVASLWGYLAPLLPIPAFFMLVVFFLFVSKLRSLLPSHPDNYYKKILLDFPAVDIRPLPNDGLLLISQADRRIVARLKKEDVEKYKKSKLQKSISHIFGAT